ncbi:hypothetical protein EON66_04505 [archaeon]|nr:MAG: hypothetical protein EON66_04505 [archaeon]
MTEGVLKAHSERKKRTRTRARAREEKIKIDRRKAGVHRKQICRRTAASTRGDAACTVWGVGGGRHAHSSSSSSARSTAGTSAA